MRTLFGDDFEASIVTDQDFETFWKLGPWRMLGKKESYRDFRKTVKTKEDMARIQKARSNYVKDLNLNPRAPLHGSTFFHNWEDFESLDVVCVTKNGNGKRRRDIEQYQGPPLKPEDIAGALDRNRKRNRDRWDAEFAKHVHGEECLNGKACIFHPHLRPT